MNIYNQEMTMTDSNPLAHAESELPTVPTKRSDMAQDVKEACEVVREQFVQAMTFGIGDTNGERFKQQQQCDHQPVARKSSQNR
jgi:hypothetical protein